MYIGSYDEPTATATYGRQYLFATLEYKSVAANIRLNWTFTPTLSLQLYLQPLISSGAYSQFKELSRPKSDDYLVYGRNGSTILYNATTDQYVVDADGAGMSSPKSFDNPDFNFKSLRGNAVLRWEYLPGSVFYFVWTQNRNDIDNSGELRINRSLDRLMSAKADNIFLMKLSYYLNM